MDKNEALQVIRSNYPTDRNQLCEALETLIPELAESEDERIRKEIIQSIQDNMCVIHKDKCIAWLEKQGKQKSSDKVEPRFHEGDWVVYKNDICQIVKREEGCNKLVTVFGIEKELVNERNLSTARLWTIQDAKDGDVLSYNDGHGNDSIELIKSITDKKIEFWFCLTNGNHYEVFDGIVPYTNLVSREDATPATKEQRDLLFQKIKEAGYEWDAEKKELKKIEHKHICKLDNSYACVKFPFKAKVKSSGTIVTIHDGQLSPDGKEWIKYQSDKEDGYKIYEPDNLELVCEIEQKSDWSEEDEKMFENIFETIDTYYYIISDYKKMLSWLKSIKERMEV